MGESAVCRYLKIRGWRILTRNYRVKGGEIDIVARRLGVTAFIEVKTRSAAYTEIYGRPSDAVDEEKKRHFRYAVKRYVSESGERILRPRIDVAEVLTDGSRIKINYIKDAF